jgi:hypothetical protein
MSIGDTELELTPGEALNAAIRGRLVQAWPFLEMPLPTCRFVLLMGTAGILEQLTRVLSMADPVLGKVEEADVGRLRQVLQLLVPELDSRPTACPASVM